MNGEQNRPTLDVPTDDGRDAIDQLIRALQDGYDRGDADRYDSLFSADVLWGTPKGQTVRSYADLNAIHRRMMQGRPVQPDSSFELVSAMHPEPDLVIAQIRRTAENGGFSEMAMYVLVRRSGRWWLAAAQNTPVTDVLPSKDAPAPAQVG